MQQLTIVPHGESAAVVLPTKLMESIGWQIGDVLEAIVTHQRILLRQPEDVTQQTMIEQITHDILERRQDAYQRLA